MILNSETDFYLLGWGVPTFDSAYNFNDLVHTKGEDYGTYNIGLYSNPEVDEMIESLGTMTDLEARNAPSSPTSGLRFRKIVSSSRSTIRSWPMQCATT